MKYQSIQVSTLLRSTPSAGFHSLSKFETATNGANYQRYENGNIISNPFHEVAFLKLQSSCFLSILNRLSFLRQNRNETHSGCEGEGKLVRHMGLLERQPEEIRRSR